MRRMLSTVLALLLLLLPLVSAIADGEETQTIPNDIALPQAGGGEAEPGPSDVSTPQAEGGEKEPASTDANPPQTEGGQTEPAPSDASSPQAEVEQTEPIPTDINESQAEEEQTEPSPSDEQAPQVEGEQTEPIPEDVFILQTELEQSETASTDIFVPQMEEDITQISVTVPLQATLVMSFNDKDCQYQGISPEGYGISNNGDLDVYVTSISVSMAEGYALIAKDQRDATSKEIVASLENPEGGKCNMLADAGADNVVVSEHPQSQFDSIKWRVNSKRSDPDNLLEVFIRACFPGGIDESWFEGSTKIFTLTYTIEVRP